MHIKLSVTGNNRTKIVKTSALIDSGAGGEFVSEQFVKQNNLHVTELNKPVPVFNVDGTPNHCGAITQSIWLDIRIGTIQIPTKFYVTSLGKEDMILGLPWLRRTKPDINWETGAISIRSVKSNTDAMIWAALSVRTVKAINIPTRKAWVEDTIDQEDPVRKNPNAPWLLMETAVPPSPPESCPDVPSSFDPSPVPEPTLN